MNSVLNINDNQCKLSVIVPFRDDPALPYLASRLEEQCSLFPDVVDIEYIVVDSGSDIKSGESCREICNANRVKYLYHDSRGKPFSIGEARDYGVQHASGKAVTFLDVDLRVDSTFWFRLLKLMKVYGISTYKKTFLAVPCLYLTEQGTNDFDVNDDELFLSYYVQWMQGDLANIQNLAACSSVMVVDKLHYLSIGGHRREFRGHGYEDFELYHRLGGEENIVPRAHDYYTDKKTWEPATYNGFRSQFSIFARVALMTNLYVFHLWHPRSTKSSFYSQENTKKNREIWQDFFKEFDITREHPKPIPLSANIEEKFIFWGESNTNASRCLRDIFPFLGSPVYFKENEFFLNDEVTFSPESFQNTLKNLNISSVVFTNPYGNDNREIIYKWCKANGVKCYCFDRGALPESWFIDLNGFNAESSSYSAEKWDKALSEDDLVRVEQYIHDYNANDSYLEEQGDRIGAEALADKLKVSGKKILFIPLQRPSDSVIRKFCGRIESYDNFIKLMDELASVLRYHGWVTLVKKHPLESNAPEFLNARYVSDETNIKDLLELSNHVCLINSGVGVLSMLSRVRCSIFGNSFYGDHRINNPSPSLNAVDLAQEIVETSGVFDENVMLKFINYLAFDFYSFGKTSYKNIVTEDGSKRNLARNIDFYKIRVDGNTLASYSSLSKPSISTSSPIFEKYKLDITNKNKAKENAKKTKPQTIKNQPKVESVQNKKIVSDQLLLDEKNAEIKGKTLFSAYSKIYSMFISEKQGNKLKNNPHEFFEKAKHPISKLGKKFFYNP